MLTTTYHKTQEVHFGSAEILTSAKTVLLVSIPVTEIGGLIGGGFVTDGTKVPTTGFRHVHVRTATVTSETTHRDPV